MSETIENKEKVSPAEQQGEWKSVPLYKHSSTVARENNEMDAFRASNAANTACAKAIEKAISDHWDGWQLSDGCAQQVMNVFGEKRMNFVLANTIRLHQNDERFGKYNLAWAQFVQPDNVMEEIPEDRRMAWEITCHPMKIDFFASQTRQIIEDRMTREMPVYREPLQYAVDNGEKNPYFDSHRCNIECRHAIEQAIADHFDGYTLHHGAPNAVLRKFGEERTLYVLANTVQIMADDGRISRSNVEWASKIFIPCGTRVDDDMRREFRIHEHPGLVNLFTKVTRDTIHKMNLRNAEKVEVSKSKQPSILEKLDNPASHVPMQEHPSKKKEQVI